MKALGAPEIVAASTAICLLLIGCGDPPAMAGDGSGTSTGVEPDLPAEGCPDMLRDDGPITVASDDELDELRGVTLITDDLRITGDVTTLDALTCLERVEGTLSIRSTTVLAGLEGLGNLRTVGYLTVYRNDELASMRGLGVRDVIQYAVMDENWKLTDVGLDELEHVESIAIGSCMGADPATFTGNSALEVLDGFDSLEPGPYTTILVAGNDSLVSVDGLVARNGNANGMSLWGNESLDITAVESAWEAAGWPPEKLDTCENLNEAKSCDCPIPP